MADIIKAMEFTKTMKTWEAYNEDSRTPKKCQVEASSKLEAIAWFRNNWEPNANISVYEVFESSECEFCEGW